MSEQLAPTERHHSEVLISLRGITKRYPGVDRDAVRPLDLDIARGEFLVLVGPSGCGKTTTLRMINRLVEPSAGEIWIDGRDVTHADADELRRHIGYVIQQVGLMPHMSVADNVGMVPKLLGWDKERIAHRVDELLDLVGLDAATFKGRYPRQLSGGQQQRVGVARALAADPPVMLMDEPFGAIDPVTRANLQAEFLGLQERIRKTIVFVTHDIDEALLLGDRIAIFDGDSRLAQLDTPLEILTNPADDFVRSFIGEGAGIRRLSLLRVGDLPSSGGGGDGGGVEVDPDDTVATVLERLIAAGSDVAVVRGGARLTLHDLLLATARDRSAVPS